MSEGRRSSRTTKGKRQLDPSFVSSQELDGDDSQVPDEDDYDDEKPKRRKSMNRTKSKTTSPVVSGVPKTYTPPHPVSYSHTPNLQYSGIPQMSTHVSLPNTGYQYSTYTNPYPIPSSTSQIQVPIPRNYILDNPNVVALLPQLYSNTQTQSTVVKPPPLMSIPSPSNSSVNTGINIPNIPSHSPNVSSHSPNVSSHSPNVSSHSPNVSSHSPVVPSSYTSSLSVPTPPAPSTKREVKSVILDIEGTTTPISFVADNLFPYVRKNLESYLVKNWDSKQLQEDIDQLRDLAKQDEEKKVEGIIPILASDQPKEKIIESIVKNVFWQMDSDRKSTALKSLQGNIWKQAYESGEIKGEVFEDVPEFIKTLNSLHIPIFIYSSGSIAAQQLLFGYSSVGDLKQYLSGFFDTTSGSKVEAASYQTILNEIVRKYPDITFPSQVLFITDNPSEVDAAQKIGISAIIADRPGNKPVPPNKYFALKSFKELLETKAFSWTAPQKLI